MVGITIIDFQKKLSKYLKSIETTGIRYVEIGFRFFEEKKIKGYACTENKLLKNLRFHKIFNSASC